MHDTNEKTNMLSSASHRIEEPFLTRLPEEARMTDSPLLKIETWVPAAVNDEAVRLHGQLVIEENPEEGLVILSRLVSDPRMKGVWTELYKTRRGGNYEKTDNYLHPARVTNLSWAADHRKQASELREKGGETNIEAAELLEAEASFEEHQGGFTGDLVWSEQDRGVQLFLWHACGSAIGIKPVYLSDISTRVAKLRTIAASLRDQSAMLKSLGNNGDAEKLDEIADDCEDDARIAEPDLETSDPWVIARDRGDPLLRTYIVDLSISATSIFRTPVYGTLATVANVVFGREDVTPEKVRELLR